MHKNITSLCPKKKTSHPRSRCKSWRCGPRPWIYPLCWQPLIEPRLDTLDGWPGNWVLERLGPFQGGKICSHVFFSMIAVFVVRKMWSQWAVISICLFFYMSCCTDSSILSCCWCCCPAMVLQPAGISTKPATNWCMAWPCMTFIYYLLSYMLKKNDVLEITPSKLLRNFLIMSHQHHFLWVICHPKVIPRWTTSPLVFERRAFALCEWDVLTRSIAF